MGREKQIFLEEPSCSKMQSFFSFLLDFMDRVGKVKVAEVWQRASINIHHSP
jgi:hypothetical protein